MVISIGDYQVRNSEGGNSKFDLHIMKEIKSGKREGEKIEVPSAYRISFERAIQIIVHEDMEKKYDALELQEFVEAHRETSEWIIGELKKLK